MKTLVLLACTLAPSRLRLFVWRLLGFQVAQGARVSIFSVVVADHIDIGSGAVIEPLSFIFRPAQLELGERARVGSFVRIVGWGGEVVLGPQTFVALGCLIDSTGGFSLGARSHIGPRCTLYSHGETGLIFNARYPHRNGPVRIEEDVWIGMGSVVHSRVTIGAGAIVLAGLTIRADVPPGRSVVPPLQEHRLVETDRLIAQVDDAVRRSALDEAFLKLASAGFSLGETNEEAPVWVAKSTRGRTVLLLRKPGTSLPESGGAEDSVAWMLSASDAERTHGIPLFVFDELTVHGPHTSFAERNAELLMRQSGAHFVFATDRPGGR